MIALWSRLRNIDSHSFISLENNGTGKINCLHMQDMLIPLNLNILSLGIRLRINVRIGLCTVTYIKIGVPFLTNIVKL